MKGTEVSSEAIGQEMARIAQVLDLLTTTVEELKADNAKQQQQIDELTKTKDDSYFGPG